MTAPPLAQPARGTAADATAARPLVPTEREQALGRADGPSGGSTTTALSPAPGSPATGTPAAQPVPTHPRRAAAVRGFVRALNPLTIDGPKAPLLLLTLVGAIGGFVTQLTTLAQPTIQTDLGVDLSVLFGVGLWANAVVALGGPWLGYLADRRDRVRQTRTGVALQAVGPIVTAFAQGIGGVFLGSTLLGVGQKVAQPATQTLLLDYYPVAERIRVVFVLFQVDGLLTVLAVPVAGGLIGAVGWRPVYLAAGVATLVTALGLLVLRETVRGYWERRELGAPVDVARTTQPPVGWAEGWRAAAGIALIRRQWLAAPFLSVAGTIGFLAFSQVYFARQFGLEVGARSGILLVQSLCGFLALVVLAPVASRAVGDRPRAVVVLQAAQGVLTAALYGLLVVTHDLLLAVVVTVVNATVASTLFPVTFTLTQAVLPPRIRAFGLQTLYAMAVPGQVVIAAGLVATGTDSLGDVVAVIAGCAVVAAVVQLTALPHVERDIANATLRAAVQDELHTGDEPDDVLVLRGLEVGYGGPPVLHGIDLAVRRGEVVALVGANGSGRTTLLRAVAGLLRPTAGAVVVAGRDRTDAPAHDTARSGVALVPGGEPPLAGLTVAESLRLAASAAGDDLATRVEAALDLVPVLRQRLGVDAAALSGGEQQLLAVAQAALLEPRLLLLDELSLGLSPQAVEALLAVVRQLRARGTAVLLVEQSLDRALSVADRAVVLDRGRVTDDVPAADLARPPALDDVLPRRRRRAPASADDDAPPALVVAGATVGFGAVRALHEVDLEVAAREVVGLLGPNGAGKTTLLDSVCGLVPLQSGRVELQGRDVTRLGLDRRAAAGLGRSFQSARLFGSLTVREVLAVAVQRATAPAGAPRLWPPTALAAERRTRARTDDALDLLELADVADVRVEDLPAGTRRTLDVGCVMASQPRVLLLDEPSSGLGRAETEALGPVLLRLVRETGCGVLVVEHDLGLLAAVSDRLVALDRGRVVTSGPVDAVLRHPEVATGYLTLPVPAGVPR